MSVSDNLHISVDNYLTNYTLASTLPPESGYPLSNLQSVSPGEFCVLDVSSTTSVTFSWSSSTEYVINCFLLSDFDMINTDTVRVQLFENASQSGTKVYDTEVVSPYGIIHNGAHWISIDAISERYDPHPRMKNNFSRVFDAVKSRSGRIVFEFDNSTKTTRAFGKMWLGPAWATRYGPSVGTVFSVLEEAKNKRVVGGHYTIDGPEYRKLALNFKSVGDGERIAFMRMLGRAGMAGDIACFPDPNDNRGRMREQTAIYKRTSAVKFSDQYYGGSAMILNLDEN